MSELRVTMRWAIGVIFFGAMVHAQTPGRAPDPRTYVPPVIKRHLAPSPRPARSRLAAPSAAMSGVTREDDTTPSALNSPPAFSALGHATSAPSTPLTPPVSITYSGSAAPALTVNDSGTNKGIASYITNSNNTMSALYGLTVGSGAGVSGYNSGLTGPAGKFETTNKATGQPAISATTVGLGPAILGTASTQEYGVGIKGVSSAYDGVGVQGFAFEDTGAGLDGEGDGGVGVSASSYTGIGLFAVSDDGPDAIYASDNFGTAIYAYTDKGLGLDVYGETSGVGINVSTFQGDGIDVSSINGPAIYAVSGGAYAIWGQSMGTVGVMGTDSGSGYGIYGSSVSGYAGYFDGKVAATSFVTLSDRDAKTNLQPVDRKDILERVDQLPISSWDFKGDLSTRHVGPMAQDFHAAFGLGGNDDTHINLADIAGVSLVAIQELNAKLQVKDAQIADLSAQLAAQSRAVADLKSIAEQLTVRMNSMDHR